MVSHQKAAICTSFDGLSNPSLDNRQTRTVCVVHLSDKCECLVIVVDDTTVSFSCHDESKGCCDRVP